MIKLVNDTVSIDRLNYYKSSNYYVGKVIDSNSGINICVGDKVLYKLVKDEDYLSVNESMKYIDIVNSKCIFAKI